MKSLLDHIEGLPGLEKCIAAEEGAIAVLVHDQRKLPPSAIRDDLIAEMTVKLDLMRYERAQIKEKLSRGRRREIDLGDSNDDE